MKILVDMNLSPLWVPFLASHGLEAIHWSTVGQSAAPDTFTHDLDFGTLLAAQGKSGPSVIQVRSQEVLPSGIGEAVLCAIRTAQIHLEKGALVTVDPIRQRIRLLPIRPTGLHLLVSNVTTRRLWSYGFFSVDVSPRVRSFVPHTYGYQTPTRTALSLSGHDISDRG
jgi:predicted nuclease of predicted toxin-antitoxin system